MLIRVFCVVSMLNKLPPGVCWRGGGGGGGGSNRLPALVAKQQAVEFPQVQTSLDKFFYHLTVSSLSPPNIVVESKNLFSSVVYFTNGPSFSISRIFISRMAAGDHIFLILVKYFKILYFMI